jgi:hypothetical protein
MMSAVGCQPSSPAARPGTTSAAGVVSLPAISFEQRQPVRSGLQQQRAGIIDRNQPQQSPSSEISLSVLSSVSIYPYGHMSVLPSWPDHHHRHLPSNLVAYFAATHVPIPSSSETETNTLSSRDPPTLPGRSLPSASPSLPSSVFYLAPSPHPYSRPPPFPPAQSLVP